MPPQAREKHQNGTNGIVTSIRELWQAGVVGPLLGLVAVG